MSSESDLQRYRNDANGVRADISKASSAVATQRKKVADAQSAAAKSKSPSTIRSKNAAAERATKAANDAERKRAGLEKKLADIEVKITRTQTKVDKERQGAQERAMRDLRKATESASAQFSPGGQSFGYPTHTLDQSPIADPDNDPGNDPGSGTNRESAKGQGKETVKEVFLSHASEDKDEIARPLKDALESRGVSVWFDEMQIQVGQSIRQRIEDGIANCRFGVVVISPHFFAKQWTNAELDALFGRKMDSGESMVLPVWHHVSKDEVLRHSPLLGGILALNSSTMTVDEMADALLAAVRA